MTCPAREKHRPGCEIMVGNRAVFDANDITSELQKNEQYCRSFGDVDDCSWVEIEIGKLQNSRPILI